MGEPWRCKVFNCGAVIKLPAPGEHYPYYCQNCGWPTSKIPPANYSPLSNYEAQKSRSGSASKQKRKSKSESSLASCPNRRCSGQLRVMVSMFLDIPVSLVGRLSKGKLRTRDVRIDGAGWDRMTIYCKACGYNDRTAAPEAAPGKASKR